MKKKELIDENNRLKKENDYLRLQLERVNKRIDKACDKLTSDFEKAVKELGGVIYLSDSSTIDGNLQFIIEYEKPFDFFNDNDKE